MHEIVNLYYIMYVPAHNLLHTLVKNEEHDYMKCLGSQGYRVCYKEEKKKRQSSFVPFIKFQFEFHAVRFLGSPTKPCES